MKLSEEQKTEFNTLSCLLIEWLNKNVHPHAKIIIDVNTAELIEGVIIYNKKKSESKSPISIE
jgi:hypothetical protein